MGGVGSGCVICGHTVTSRCRPRGWVELRLRWASVVNTLIGGIARYLLGNNLK